MRPRRKRKLTNYGEGHLHWIEESQIQKALMKSLREKVSHSSEPEMEAPNSEPFTIEPNSTPPKMPRLSVAVSNCAVEKSMKPTKDNLNLDCSVNVENIFSSKGGGTKDMERLLGNVKILPHSERKSPARVRMNQSKTNRLTPTSAAIRKKFLRSHLRHRSPQNSDQDSDSSNSGNAQHATMMQPRNSENASSSTSKDSVGMKLNLRQSRRVRVNLGFDKISDQASTSGQIQGLKTRAQRKFASNSAMPYDSCTRQRAEKKRRCGNAGVADSPAPVSPDAKLPETKDFINYLCYRNTPLEKAMKRDLFS